MRLGVGIAVGFLLIAANGAAQPTTGVIHGIVEDPGRRPISGAEVSAAAAGHRISRSTRTDGAGRYRFTELPPGTYDLTVSTTNFQTHILSGVVVRVDSRQQHDFVLALGPLRQTVEVRAEPSALDPASSSGVVLDRGLLADLPLNRRDFLQLAFLAPGVLPPVQDSELSSRGSFAMHASGAREEFNNFTIDGADNNDPYTNRYVLQPSLEAIREFKVLTSGYSAEYGRNAGGQVNVVTRSGEGVWHGAVYEYFRNRHLDARSFFDLAEKPGYSRNQFGAAAGGPAVRDRVFVFASWEGLRERRGLTRLATVPTAQERAGAAGRPIVDPFTRQPFAGNVVPEARISPIARRILDLYPLPNLPGAAGNLLSQPSLAGRLDHAWLRSDWRLSERSQLSARYGHGDEDLLEPFAEESTDIPGFGNVVRNTGVSFTVDHQLVLGPTAVQTVRFSYGRSFRRALPQNHQADAAGLWGVNWLNVRERDRGFPSIKTAGYSLAGDVDQLPLERTTGVFEGQYSISLGRGPHALRLGAGLRHSRLDGFLDFFARGSLTFSGAISGAGISDLLLGFPSFGIQSQFDNRQSLRGNAWNLYVQDEWRLRRTVTLSLGLRYELNQPPVDPDDRMYTLDLASGRTVQVGAAGVPRAGYRADRNNLAPRVGLAWMPRPGWAVRAGYGVFYDAGMMVVNSSFYFNPPIFNVRIAFPTQTSLLTLANPFATAITAAPSPNILSPDATSAYLQHWRLGVERRLSTATSAALSYVASKGTRLIRSRDLNQPRPASGPVAARRPNPAYGGIFFTETGGNSVFHSMQAILDRRLTGAVSLVAAWTWSKSIDDTSAFLGTKPDKNFPQDSLNYHAERGLSSFDMPHRFTAALVAQSPFRHWAVRAFGLRLVTAAQAGQPFTPILRFDNSNSGNTGGIFGSDRPNLIGDPRLDERGPARWFNTAAFAVTPPFTFGSAGRNIVRGPGLFTVDAGLSRRFALNERWRLIADAQVFNLANRAQFDLPERFADEPATFGRIFSAKASRQVQIALRVEF